MALPPLTNADLCVFLIIHRYAAICGDQRWNDPSPACINAINAFTDETGTGGLAGSTYNVYDMCGNDDAAGFTTSAEKRADGAAGIYAPLNDQKRRAPGAAAAMHDSSTHAPAAAAANATARERQVGDHANGKGGLNNSPCGEAVGMTAWLNVKAVQDALHVTVAHRPDGKWCVVVAGHWARLRGASGGGSVCLTRGYAHTVPPS